MALSARMTCGVARPLRSVVVSLCAALAVLTLGCTLTGQQEVRDAAPAPRPRVAPTPAPTADIQQVSAVDPATPGAKPPDAPVSEPEPTLPAPRNLPGLTLDQVINQCLVADPKIRTGLEAINQANADALTASLKPNPTLFADIQLLPLTRPFTVTDQGGPPQQDVQVGYPIDWFLFGKRAAAMAASARGVRVSQAEYADLIRERVTDAAVAYFDLLEAKALRNLAQQDVQNFKRVEASVRKAVEAGGRAVVELNRVRLELLKREQALLDAELTVVTARAKLRARLGRSDADPAFDIAGSLDVPLRGRPLPADEAYSLALQNRPDMAALRWKVAQAQANVDLERRKAFPEVTPNFGYTRQYQLQAIGFPDASSWSAAVTMTLPICNRNQGNRAKANSLAVQSQFELRTEEVNLRSEIETIVQEFATAHAKAEAVAQDQLRLSTEVRDSITRAYDEAKGRTLLDVLEAQRDFRETYRLYISSRAAYWRAWYKFSSAIGMQVVPHDKHAGEPAAPNP